MRKKSFEPSQQSFLIGSNFLLKVLIIKSFLWMSFLPAKCACHPESVIVVVFSSLGKLAQAARSYCSENYAPFPFWNPNNFLSSDIYLTLLISPFMACKQKGSEFHPKRKYSNTHAHVINLAQNTFKVFLYEFLCKS